MIVQLERRKQELIGSLKKTAALTEDWNDEQRKEVEDNQAELTKITADLEQRKHIETLDTEYAKRSEPVTGKGDGFDAQCAKFSIRKALASMLGESVDAGLEKECSAELCKRDGRDKSSGFVVPMQAFERRVQTTTSSANIIEPNYLPQEFAAPLRDSLISSRLGVRVLSGLTGRQQVKIPRQATSGSTAYVAENAAIASSDVTFDQVTADPKTLAGMREWSRLAALTTDPQVEDLLRRDLTETMADALDKTLILGGGTNEPSGIMTAVTVATARASSTNGKALSYSDALQLVANLDTANIADTSRAFLTDTRVINKGLQTEIFTSTGRTIVEGGQLAGQRTIVSNHSPLRDRTKGTGTALSAVIFGQWNECYLCQWGGMELLLNPYETDAYSKGNIKVRAMMTVGIAIRRTGAFSYYNDVIAV